MNYLSLCAIVRNEAPYLVEWLHFYEKQGVEKFYIYDNGSDDHTRHIVKAYLHPNQLVWHDLPGFKQQRVAYNHMISEYADETVWCCFFDVDEFCYHHIYPTIKEGLQQIPYDVGGLSVNWLLFGSAGEKKYRPDPVTKRFTMRAAKVNPHVKSIMRMKSTYSMGMDPHTFRSSLPIINEKGHPLPVEYALSDYPTADFWRINHYHNKSLAEYLQRRKLPDANSGVFKDPMEQFLAHDTNEVEDKRIWERI